MSKKPASRPIALRASESEREAWEAAAQAAGVRLSAWLRRAANSTALLEKTLDIQEAEKISVKHPPSISEVKDMMYPQKRKRCVHRMMPGEFCKKCGTTK